ncbi:AER217Wp [Eremothecium gossypii ATCC 10895]|uniref:AER217Wp n=1 Tax=Eremothecium gossypii (strain ATCC 10895 / CBS 109.51 / FGSC 9923 / NRRL Y-1056) TaxID=284811 RepID=Q756N7_EREGS|nr:AER217Wp [Eremothecium gossypii ATCC 10895]AAS52898.1 AER217Wp [Eremothecium gossypii ATCC 10895]AEY97206.1 FAER217Wp [Eremothecium gossypii FDAG1]
MRHLGSVIWLLFGAVAWVGWSVGSPVTFELRAGKEECYYLLLEGEACSVTYYFAVQQDMHHLFEVDYRITGPEGVVTEARAKQGEWQFEAGGGEYAFCLRAHSGGDQVVDLELVGECGVGRGAAAEPGFAERLRDALDQIERRLNILQQQLQYYHGRNLRSHATVHATVQKMPALSVYSLVLIAGLAWAQVVVVKILFGCWAR